MTQQAGRKHQPMSGDTGWLIGGGIMAVVVMIIGMYVVSLYVDPGIREAAGSSSVQTMLAAQITGRAPMTALQIVVFVGELVLLAAVGVLIFFAWRRTRGTKSRVDDRARDMTRVKDMSELGSKAAKKDAERLEATSAGDGVPWASWSTICSLCGPRGSGFRSGLWDHVQARPAACVCPKF